MTALCLGKIPFNGLRFHQQPQSAQGRSEAAGTRKGRFFAPEALLGGQIAVSERAELEIERGREKAAECRFEPILMRRIAGIVSLYVVLSACTANQAGSPFIEFAPNQSAIPETYQPPAEEPYRISVGDKLTIRSYDDSGLLQELVVRPDGRISVLFLGDVKVVGMMPDDLDTLLTETYSE